MGTAADEYETLPNTLDSNTVVKIERKMELHHPFHQPSSISTGRGSIFLIKKTAIAFCFNFKSYKIKSLQKKREMVCKQHNMETQILHPAFQPEWDLEDIRMAFFKCTRWQVEETLDPLTCPFHYFCDSVYPGHYPPVVDVLVLLLSIASYLATLIIMLIDISKRGRPCLSQSKRLLLPSGPLLLPLILLALAKGLQINTLYPLSCIAPAILQLVQISSLAFDTGVDKDPRYAFLEASTISGILHASVYLDSIILPYYTGIDALASSTFSGECLSCVCRKQVLVAGGKLITYRGLSVTTFCVMGGLCLRIICRLSTENKGLSSAVKSLLECLAWILITKDCIYLVANSPPEQPLLQAAAFGGILVLICLHGLKKLCMRITQWHR